MNTPTTTTDKIAHNHTSVCDRVNIDVEPNKVEHTSAAILDEVANRLISKYPTANEPTEIIAIDASPLIFVF